ncbi:MAG: HD domain-containing protein [Lachnospiraceae bacterium]|nr:HD domain-containing protein [Lachnospiraceae bacterium]
MAICIAITVNVLLSFAVFKLGFPLYLDTIGTIIMATMGGFFPGVVTAVVTNLICSFFNREALYFAVINALAALFVSSFSRKRSLNRAKDIGIFIVIISILCGSLSSIIQWEHFGGPQDAIIRSMVDSTVEATGYNGFVVLLIINLILNFLDKGLVTMVSCYVMSLIPEEMADKIEGGAWMQRPLSKDEKRSIKEWGKDVRQSLRFRMTVTLSLVSLVLVLLVGGAGLRLYIENVKAERTKEAGDVAHMVAAVLDAEMINDYILGGDAVEGYEDTVQVIEGIRNNMTNVKYLYVARAEKDGFRYVFDARGDEGSPEPYKAGEMVPYEHEFLPYVEDLIAGKEIDPVESNDSWGWLISAAHPVKNSEGNTVCYVIADVSIELIADFMREYIFKIGLIIAAIFIVIVGYGLWTTGIYTSYPITSMAYCVDHFSQAGEDQDKLDDNVRSIRSLDIHTGDETEKLYNALCRLTLNQAEQMRNVRRLSDSTAQMQDGLIITMADMVESRDSDTGAHVQKTAAYVKIIVEGLKKKGYYSEKITPKFISDVIRSAPLHDVGKINISDKILNKVGKLTDEEYEIMKTHTTAGKKIMENAISTVKGENYLKEARNMAAYHHERWDGKGYPEGLHGEVIPLSARIMAVADVFDALSSPRVYKPAFSIEKSIEIIKEGSGTQFDPKCVEVFMEALTEVKLIVKKYNQES